MLWFKYGLLTRSYFTVREFRQICEDRNPTNIELLQVIPLWHKWKLTHSRYRAILSKLEPTRRVPHHVICMSRVCFGQQSKNPTCSAEPPHVSAITQNEREKGGIFHNLWDKAGSILTGVVSLAAFISLLLQPTQTRMQTALETMSAYVTIRSSGSKNKYTPHTIARKNTIT